MYAEKLEGIESHGAIPSILRRRDGEANSGSRLAVRRFTGLFGVAGSLNTRIAFTSATKVFIGGVLGPMYQ